LSVRGSRLAALVPALLAGCAGIFQRDLPRDVDRYAIRVPVADVAVGSAEADITPTIGGYLGGFDLNRPSTEVASALKVRVLVLLTPTRRFAIVGVDNLGLMREDVDWLKSALTGFANGDVFVCASHTHAGPDLIGIWGNYMLSSGRDRDYLAAVRTATATAVAAAVAAARPAAFCRGEARLPPTGLVKNANRAGVFDRRVTVLQAQARADGTPLGTLLHLACHPEVQPRRNTAISADFVGELCDRWRQAGHGQAVFVNGALGAMISPAVAERNEAGARALGAAVHLLAEQALAAASPLPIDAIEVARADVYLPMVSAGFRLARLATALERELFDGQARSSVGYLRLGTFEALALPGEAEPGYAERLRATLRRPNLVVFGLCDDEVGYLLRDQEAVDPEFAYERSMSPCRSAGERVHRAVLGAIDR
jgi:hypothetical protein